MRKALVCGGAGFVGSAVVRELLAHDCQVVVIERPGAEQMIPARLSDTAAEICLCDMKDIKCLPDLLPQRDFDIYYNFAWEGLTNALMTDYTIQIANIVSVMDAIQTASVMGCKRFVGAGTISQTEVGCFDQTDKHRIYKVANFACEHMGKSVAEACGVDFFWPIITNIYGPGEFSERLANTMIRSLYQKVPQKFSAGEQLYDFVYITDAARAFRLIGERGNPASPPYVIGSGGARPLKEFLMQICDVVAPQEEPGLGLGELPYHGVYHTQEDFDIAPLTRDTGFQAEVDFRTGIRRTAAWIASACCDKQKTCGVSR